MQNTRKYKKNSTKQTQLENDNVITDNLNISAPVFKSRLKTFFYRRSCQQPLCDLNCACNSPNRPIYACFLHLFTYLLDTP